MTQLTVTLSLEQWNALAETSRHGVNAHDLLGADEPTFNLDEATVQRAHEARQIIEEHTRDVVLSHRHTAPVAIEAEQFPLAVANQEGWTIDFCEERGEHVVRRLEDSGYFRNDDAALMHVMTRSTWGTYHEAALAWIDKANILQRASVVRSKVKFSEAAE